MNKSSSRLMGPKIKCQIRPSSQRILSPLCVNSNLVQYLLQTDIHKRTEKIQWQIQALHRDFSPGNPNRENQHILY
jgi:hypothetical protein